MDQLVLFPQGWKQALKLLNLLMKNNMRFTSTLKDVKMDQKPQDSEQHLM